jgi:hypothetical protein
MNENERLIAQMREQDEQRHPAPKYSVHDFVSVENGEELTVWTADGKRLVALSRRPEAELEQAAQKIRDALVTWPGWTED